MNIIEIELTEDHLAVLTEIGNVGAGHAADALSTMIGRQVLMTVPNVKVEATESIVEKLDKDSVIAAIYFKIEGTTDGAMVMLFSEKSAGLLIDTLVGKELGTTSIADPASFDEMDESAIKEVGNVLVCHFADTISNMIGGKLTPSIPYMAIDMAGAIVQSILIGIAERYESAIVFETDLQGDVEADMIETSLLFLPEQKKFFNLVKKLAAET